MSLNWIVNPATQYAALALALFGCLVVFLSLKREMARIRRFAESSSVGVTDTVQVLSDEVKGIQEALQALGPGVCQTAPAYELSLNKRANALRMHRRGESPASIAAILQAPQNEIDLLLKVNQLLNPERP
jgi:hypothetical protein